MHDPRRDPLGERQPAHRVAGEHAQGQPVGGVGGERDGLVLGAEPHDRRHRPEDLLPVGGRVDADPVQDRRPVEQPVEGAAGGEPGAAGDARLHQAVHLVPLTGVDERAERHLPGVRVPDRQRVGVRGEPLDILVGDVGVHEVPAGRHADLPRVQVGAPRPGGHREVQVRVGQDDERGVAAELQVDPLEVPPGELGDGPSGGGRAGERDDPDRGVRDQRRADVGAAGQDVQQALGQARLAQQRGDREPAADGRARVRLQHDRVADGERRRDGADREDEREVERGDDADDPHGRPPGEAEPGQGGGQDVAERPGRERRRLVALLGRDVRLDGRLRRHRTGLPDQPRLHVGREGLEPRAGPAQHPGPLPRSSSRPTRAGPRPPRRRPGRRRRPRPARPGRGRRRWPVRRRRGARRPAGARPAVQSLLLTMLSHPFRLLDVGVHAPAQVGEARRGPGRELVAFVGQVHVEGVEDRRG